MAVQMTSTPDKKPVTNLPLQDPNNPNQPIPVNTPAPQINPQQVQPVGPAQSQTSQLATQALQRANSQAQSGFKSNTAYKTSQLAQNLLTDPNQGYNPQQQVKSGLTQYDRSVADALEVARQGMVGASGSSIAQSGLQDLALRTAEGRGDLKNTLEQTANEQTTKNILNALTAGKSTTEMEQGINTGNINNVLSVLNAAQPQLQREETAIDRGLAIAQANQNAQLQTSLTELKGKIDQGLLLTQQDFEGTQAELDREIQKWTAEGNWNNALNAINLKGEIDSQAQAAAQKWQTGERISTQVFSTNERLSEQDFVAAQDYLNRKSQEAIANGDNDTQKYVAQKQYELQLKMQTNDMAHDEKMAYTNSLLEDARANNDVERQKSILQYQSSLNLAEMDKEAGYDMAIENLRADTQTKIAEGNNAAVAANLKAELEYKINADIENRKLDWAANALQEKGLDMSIYQQQLDTIDDLIENDGLDPSIKMQFVKSTLEGQGVDTSAFRQIDVATEAQKALSADFDLQLYQFGITHPEYAVNIYGSNGRVMGTTGELTPEGLKAFNEYFNEYMYGELSPEKQEAKRTAGWITDPADILFAVQGDKVKITEPYTLSVDQTGSSSSMGGAAGAALGGLFGGLIGLPSTGAAIGGVSGKGNDQPAGTTQVSIPAGEYSVIEESDATGSKFLGTARDTVNTYLVDGKGNKYLIKSNRGKTQGNIISGLWAGQ